MFLKKITTITSPRPLDHLTTQTMMEKLTAEVHATRMTQSYFDHVAAVAKLGSILCLRARETPALSDADTLSAPRGRLPDAPPWKAVSWFGLLTTSPSDEAPLEITTASPRSVGSRRVLPFERSDAIVFGDWRCAVQPMQRAEGWCISVERGGEADSGRILTPCGIDAYSTRIAAWVDLAAAEYARCITDELQQRPVVVAAADAEVRGGIGCISIAFDTVGGHVIGVARVDDGHWRPWIASRGRRVELTASQHTHDSRAAALRSLRAPACRVDLIDAVMWSECEELPRMMTPRDLAWTTRRMDDGGGFGALPNSLVVDREQLWCAVELCAGSTRSGAREIAISKPWALRIQFSDGERLYSSTRFADLNAALRAMDSADVRNAILQGSSTREIARECIAPRVSIVQSALVRQEEAAAEEVEAAEAAAASEIVAREAAEEEARKAIMSLEMPNSVSECSSDYSDEESVDELGGSGSVDHELSSRDDSGASRRGFSRHSSIDTDTSDPSHDDADHNRPLEAHAATRIECTLHYILQRQLALGWIAPLEHRVLTLVDGALLKGDVALGALQERIAAWRHGGEEGGESDDEEGVRRDVGVAVDIASALAPSTPAAGATPAERRMSLSDAKLANDARIATFKSGLRDAASSFSILETAFSPRAPLAPQEQSALLGLCSVRRFRAGETLAWQGDPVTTFYIILEGNVLLEGKTAEHGRTFARMYAGHSLIILLAGGMECVWPFTITAEVDLECAAMRSEQASALCNRNERISKLLQILTTNTCASVRLRRQRGGNIASETMTAQLVTRAPKASMRVVRKLERRRTAAGSLTINSYVVERILGRGTFGKVWLCRADFGQGEYFAIKVMRRRRQKYGIQELSSSASAAKGGGAEKDPWFAELEIMNQLDHPNVVQLVEAIDDPSAENTYLVQEYVSGGQVMPEAMVVRPVPRERCWTLFRDILKGVEYLHARGIVHRDLKPANILVTRSGRAKISDFGVSHGAGVGPDRLVDTQGTPHFMAPEVCGLYERETEFSGQAADMWSIGGTLFAMITGRPPFSVQAEAHHEGSAADVPPGLGLEGPAMDDWHALMVGKLQPLLYPPSSSYPPEYGDPPWALSTRQGPSLRNLLLCLMMPDPKLRMTLGDAMAHMWVTNEGSEPLERTVYVEQKAVPRRFRRRTIAASGLQKSALAAMRAK